MSTKSWYVLKLNAIPTRYGLSKNIQVLLHALDSYYTGSIDDVELGRLVRLSPNRRSAIANTITKCANMIKKKPEEVKTCVDVIEMCTEILEIAGKFKPGRRLEKDAPELTRTLDRQTQIRGFPFRKLPAEIREMILDLMIDNVFRTKTIVPASKKSTCRCPKFERESLYQNTQVGALPALLGPSFQDFFRIFFRKKRFRFKCSCELLAHLTANAQLSDNVRHIVVHWCGPDSAKAFKALAKCHSLESLTITISKGTLTHVDERASIMKSFFPLANRANRITDALGLNELLELRGLREVEVTHTQPRNNTYTVEMDRASMADLLSTKLTMPREEMEEMD